MRSSTEREEVLRKAYRLISQSEEGIIQSELWRKLNISSRKASQIVKELIERGFISREKVLYRGRWTYRLISKREEEGIDLIKDAYCLICPLEPKCSPEEPKYLIQCKHLENWVLRKYDEQLKGKSLDEKK
ncbi:transcriptional regulator [Candidatus Geothermarchaeota archaeon]|nr:MAG: transcriptional regulator [Candidatus Geothermarchaeota archaeon]